MKTEIYEVDPFTSRKDKLITTIDSDYRFERQDEIFIDGARVDEGARDQRRREACRR